MLIRLSSWMLCRFRADRARKASSTPMDLSFSGRFSFRLTSERFFPIIFFDIVPEAGPPQSPPSFPQRRLWSVWQLLYWMLLVVYTWLIKIIPLRLYTLIVHSSDNITVHFSEVCKKILEQFFLFLLLSRRHWCHQKPPDFQDEFSIWSQDAAVSAQFHLSPICHWPLIFKYWRSRPISV